MAAWRQQTRRRHPASAAKTRRGSKPKNGGGGDGVRRHPTARAARRRIAARGVALGGEASIEAENGVKYAAKEEKRNGSCEMKAINLSWRK
jgi:hypothetical protein